MAGKTAPVCAGSTFEASQTREGARNIEAGYYRSARGAGEIGPGSRGVMHPVGVRKARVDRL